MTFLAALLLALAPAQEAKPRKIVLLAGPLDSHPRDSHEYEKNVILLVVTGDKGLAGGFNTNVNRAVGLFLREAPARGIEKVRIVTIGRKGHDFWKRRPYEIIESHIGFFSKFGYVDAIVAPAPDDRAGYAENATKLDAFFIREGALRTVDGWGADVPDGKVTDFKRAVAAEAGEQIVFGWIEWPDKATRDAAFAKVMQNPEMQAIKPAFDMQRAIFGGFVPILNTDHQ